MNELRLASPLWLFFCAPLLVATVFSIRGDRRAAILYSSAELLGQLPVTFAQRVKRALPWLHFAALSLVVIGLARPQLGLQEFRIRTEGIAIVMCIDRSGSMMALDFKLDGEAVNRLQAVKRVFHDFVGGDGRLPGRPDDMIGLVSFGGYAEAKSPLTLDHGALLQVLESVEIAQPIYDSEGRLINRAYLEEERATAIGDAVALAVDRLQGAEAESKVVILLSDGENTAGIIDPTEAADAARNLGIKIYSIGVGTTGHVPFPEQDRFGRPIYRPRFVQLDETTLSMLAEKTGGQYFNAKDTQALEKVYADIDKLEKTVVEGRLYTEYRELFQWFLIPGLALVLVEFVLRCTRFRSLP